MTIRAVLFDIGGVLVRTGDHAGRRKWEQRLGLERGGLHDLIFESEKGRRAQLGKISPAELWAWAGGQFGLDTSRSAELARDFWAGDALDCELVSLIRRLRPAVQTAVISNANADLRRELEDKWAIADLFDLIICSAEEGVMKPEPEIYLRALRRLGRRPQEAVFVDDRADNVVGAQQVGMAAIHYRAGMDLAAELDRLGLTVPAAASDRENIMKSNEAFEFRPATLADAAAVVDLLSTYAKRVAGEQDLDEETLLAEWQSPGFDLAAASQVALGGDGQIVAYADFFGDRGARLFGWAAVHPDYFNRGLGTRLMDWIDVRARRAAEKLPEELEVILQTSVYAQDAHGRAFLEALGMQPVRRFWTMAAALDGPPARPHFPNGFEVRPMASMAEFPAVIQALRDAFQDHWGNVEVSFEQEYEGWLHRMESAGDNPMHWILALDGPEVAGLVAYRLRSYEDPDMAWVAELAVRRPWRRRGLGLALLLEAFGHLDSLGARRVGLGVDSQSLTGATELYRKAGMRVKTERDVYEKLIRPGRPAIRRELESAAA